MYFINRFIFNLIHIVNMNKNKIKITPGQKLLWQVPLSKYIIFYYTAKIEYCS